MTSTAATNYWKECLGNAAEESGLTLTDEQVTALAWAAESAHENYSQAFYSPPAGEYLEAENARLRRELERERSLVQCKTCGGTGRIISYGGTFSFDSQCHKCGGDGRVLR